MHSWEDGSRVFKVVCHQHGYGWTQGAFVLIEVPELDVVTTIDRPDGMEDEGVLVEAMDAARSAIMDAASRNGGIGEDGAFALDIEFEPVDSRCSGTTRRRQDGHQR